MIFWKKWLPNEGSIGSYFSPISIITLEFDIDCHCTGIPSHGSVDPHLPGPQSIYWRPLLNIELIFDNSFAISFDLLKSKVFGLTIIKSFNVLILPSPKENELLQKIESFEEEDEEEVKEKTDIQYNYPEKE